MQHIQPTWLLQYNFIDEFQKNSVAEAAWDVGANILEVGVIPFSDDLIDDMQDNLSELGQYVIPYGSTKLTKWAQRYKWKGVFFNKSTFNVHAWTANRTDMLNQKVIFTTVGQVANTLAGRDPEELMFIRPLEDLKAFNGTVTAVAEILNWMDSVESGNFSFNADTPIAISEVQEILAEWRYFVVGGKVIDGSSYRMRGLKLNSHETNTEVLLEAQALADIWLPHETCVMDVALTPTGVKVIEFNCLNSSGFYYHDIPKIVSAVSDYVGQL